MMTVPESERDFASWFEDALRLYGWRWCHFRASYSRRGRWATHLSGTPGFPDYVAAHPERGILFAELKAADGRLTPGQEEWLEALRSAAKRGVTVALWRPDYRDAILSILRRGAR